jgi:hypothetical protein
MPKYTLRRRRRQAKTAKRRRGGRRATQRRQPRNSRGGTILGEGAYGAVYYDMVQKQGLSCTDDGRILQKPGVVSKIMKKPNAQLLADEMILNELIKRRGMDRAEVEQYFLLPERGCTITEKSCNAGNYCEQANICDTCDKPTKTGIERLDMMMTEKDPALMTTLQKSNPEMLVRYAVLPLGESNLSDFINKNITDPDIINEIAIKLKEMVNGINLISLQDI